MPNKVWYLGHSRLFQGIPLKEIQKYAHLFHEFDCKPKEIVFAEGDAGDAIYVLKTGHVRLYRLTEDGKEITIAILGPGDVFGELALFERGQRTTFAESMDNTHLCKASVDEFMRLMANKPQLTMMIAREIARRRDEAETHIAWLAYGTVRGRVAGALRYLAQQHGEVVEGGAVRINLRLPHHEIAHLVGASRETCTVELRRLQHAGIIELDEEHHIIVRKPDRLQLGPLDRLLHAVVGN